MAEEMINISFIGDISLNDSYRSLYKSNTNPFEPLKSYLSANDYLVGNLECMAEGSDGENTLKKPRLTTDTETLNYLKEIDMSVACLANNHVYDHLADGYKNTVQFLEKNNIQHIGAGLTCNEASEPIVLQKGDIKVGLLNYVTEDTNPNLPDNAGIRLNLFNIAKCIDEIKNLKKKVNHVVLLLHWGGRVEGGLFPDWDQPKIARELIDAGADLIVGHHSHTIQPYEIYKGKYIFYSLGNFCFADLWFDGRFYPMPKNRLVTAILTINFSNDGYLAGLQFFKNKYHTFSIFNGYNYRIIIRNWVFKNLLKFKFLWKIYFFHKNHLMEIIQFSFRKDISFMEKVVRVIKSIKKKKYGLHKIN